jgi:hypothetical protein
MDSVDKFYKWYRSIIAGTIPIVMFFAQSLIETFNIRYGKPFTTIIIVFSVVVFVQISELIADFIIIKWKWFRKKLYGRAYIEGFAIDVTYDTDTREVYYGTLNRFCFSKGRIEGEAELFNHEGVVVGNFDLTTYYHTEKQIKYAFEGTVAGGSVPNTQYVGYGEMRFGAHEGRPKTYTGFYIDNNDFTQHFFEGEFLWENNNFKELEKDTKARAEFLESFIVEFCRRKEFKRVKQVLIDETSLTINNK